MLIDSIAAVYFVSISLITPDLPGHQTKTLSQNILQAVCFSLLGKEREKERDRHTQTHKDRGREGDRDTERGRQRHTGG